jgi:hypothetical protein
VGRAHGQYSFLGYVHATPSLVDFGGFQSRRTQLYSAPALGTGNTEKRCSENPGSRRRVVLQLSQARSQHPLPSPLRERRTRGPLLFIGSRAEGPASLPTALIFDWLLGPGCPRLLPSHIHKSHAPFSWKLGVQRRTVAPISPPTYLAIGSWRRVRPRPHSSPLAGEAGVRS